MNKYHYIIITITKNGKYYAYTEKVHGSNNLMSMINRNQYISSINICSTKTEADSVSEMWNKSYEENGTLLPFTEMP